MSVKKIIFIAVCLVLFCVFSKGPARSYPDNWTKQEIKERNEARERSAEIQQKRITDFENRQADRRNRNEQKQKEEALESKRPVKPVRQTTSALILRVSKLEQQVDDLSDVVEFLLERVSALEGPAESEIKSQENPEEIIIVPGKMKTLPAGVR